ncbi:MAG: glycoside hydrolase family 3 N-terminal domain-containing protein [Hyphomicrobiaceae bacterium]
MVSLVLAAFMCGPLSLVPGLHSAGVLVQSAEAKPRKAVRAPIKKRFVRKQLGRPVPKALTARQRFLALQKARQRQIPAPQAAPPRLKGIAASAAPAAATAAAAPLVGAIAGPQNAEKPPTLAEMRAMVLAAPDETLRRLGRHLIVGYHRTHQITPLLERGALGGVFVTSRNARGRTKAQITKELAEFREMSARAGQKSFWIATDQEGGTVSRMSPPMPYQPSLGQVIAKAKTPEERRTAVTEYASKQSAALAEMGINLNFAPVADLNFAAARIRDRHTRVRHRAISGDAEVVAEVAATYCATLRAHEVACTLKHFPGLGRVTADTHLVPAALKTPIEVLEAKDWKPFRRVIEQTPAFLMIGHQSLAVIDPDNPASASEEVIQGILRRDWGFNGIVITDDLAMGAIRHRRAGGMPKAAVDALNAGADLVLLGLDGDHVYAVLYEMMKAEERGALGAHTLGNSRRRLMSAAGTLTLARDRSGQRQLSGEDSKAKTVRQ